MALLEYKIYGQMPFMASIDENANDASRAFISDEELIISIAMSQDRDAYRNLFGRFAPKIKGFLIGRGCTNTEAEDITQDAMLKIWQNATQFNPTKAKASTWIYTIVRNLRIDYLRKQKRISRLKNEYTEEPNIAALQNEKIAQSQSAKIVREAIEELPEDQLRVVRLSFYEDLSHSQIADALGLPLGTVKSRLRLALEKLKSLRSDNGEKL